MSRSFDVVVVGAGPAGAVAAYALGRAGADVLLVDRQAFPRWKVCGACLSRGALEVLEEAGLGDLAARRGGVPLHRLELAEAGGRATLPLEGSRALSRGALDAALVAAATSAGARFESGRKARIERLHGGRRWVRLSGGGIDEVVGASVVLDASGLGGFSSAGSRKSLVAPGSRIGVGATLTGVDDRIPPGALHMVVGRRGYVGLVRLEDGSLNVGAALDADLARGRTPADAVAAILTEAGHPVPHGDVLHGWRGTPALTRLPAAAGAERLLRVGDAAGYVEPFTGEGMCWALASGLAAAELAREGADAWTPELLVRWRAYDATTMARARRLCRAVAWGLRRPAVVRGAVAALERAPALAIPFRMRAARRPAAHPPARGHT